jgi:hypothetical protein
MTWQRNQVRMVLGTESVGDEDDFSAVRFGGSGPWLESRVSKSHIYLEVGSTGVDRDPDRRSTDRVRQVMLR